MIVLTQGKLLELLVVVVLLSLAISLLVCKGGMTG